VSVIFMLICLCACLSVSGELGGKIVFVVVAGSAAWLNQSIFTFSHIIAKDRAMLSLTKLNLSVWFLSV
jgi:hypothetical protein